MATTGGKAAGARKGAARKKTARKKAKAGRGKLKASRRQISPGPPTVEFDLEALEELGRLGCTNEEIARLLKVAKATLQRRIADTPEVSEAIAIGRARMARSLRTAQLRAALGGNATMMIWLGKQTLGQRDVRAVELTGEGGGAVEVDHQLAEVILKRLEAYNRSRSTTS